jgi:hypothetical protein
MPEKSLVEQLTDAIEENGSLTETSRKKLMLMVMTETYNNTLCLPELKNKVTNLERKSIVIQAQNHPKITTILVVAGLVFIMILFTIWTKTGVDGAVLSLLGL